MTGIRPLNLHSGDQAEYFAIWGLSALAQVIPVPRQEDYGIDVFCGLTKIHKSDLIIENVFGVQIKKLKKNIKITYGGKNKKGKWKKYEIEWLLFKPYHPLFILISDIHNKKIDIFSTSVMWHIRWQGYAYQINLIPYKTGDINGRVQNKLIIELPKTDYGDCSIWNVPLGNPIISLHVNDFIDKSKITETYELLKHWIEIDHKNVTHQLLNIPFYQHYKEWVTNVKPDYNKLESRMYGSTKPIQGIENIFKMLKTMKPIINTLQFQLQLSDDTESNIVNEFYDLVNRIFKYKAAL